MNLEQKLQSTDDFWSTKAQEEAAVRKLDTEIGTLKGAIGLAEKMMGLRASPGWLDFVKAVEGCKAWRQKELEACQGSNEDMRILQGRCRELNALLGMMGDTEKNTKLLAERLGNLENERKLFVRADGKVQPQGVVT